MSEMPLHQNDRKILEVIQHDATLSLKELAERVAMSQSTVWRRMQELQACGVITGRVTLVDPLQVGLAVCCIVQVNIVEHGRQVRDDFERFVTNCDAVLQCFAVTGSHDYMLVVRTATVEDYESFLMNDLLAHPSVASTASHLALRQTKNTTVLPC